MVEQIVAGAGVPEAMIDIAEVQPAPKKKASGEPGSEERKKYNRVKQTESRERAKQKKSAESAKYTSSVIPTKAEAKEYLATRIVNQHVIDTCYDLGLLAAEKHGLLANKFFWL